MLRGVKYYRRPDTIADAVALVQSNPNSAYLGGGAWIVAQGDPSLEMVVDLQDLGIGAIETTMQQQALQRQAGLAADAQSPATLEIRIGAMASLQALIEHPDIASLADGLLARAAGYVQSRSLREQGTVGGTLITAGPADPLTTALLVLDAEVYYADPVIHKAPFMSFVAFRDRLIRTQVLLTEVRLQRPSGRCAAAFEVVGRSPKDKPIVCAAAYLEVNEGLPSAIRLAVGGAHTQPVRLHKTEHILRGQLLSQSGLDAALAPSLAELDPPSDFRGSAEYRLAMAQVLARRAVFAAWQVARRPGHRAE
jgi:CO/xanthine dehydrogenase FAD-binding subunit